MDAGASEAGTTMHEQIGAIFAHTAAELNTLIEREVHRRVSVREQEAIQAKTEADQAMQKYRHELKRLVRLLKLGCEKNDVLQEEAANPEFSSLDDDELAVLAADEEDEPTKKPTRKRGKRAAVAKSTQQRIEDAARRASDNPPWNPNKSVLDAFAIVTKPPPPQ